MNFLPNVLNYNVEVKERFEHLVSVYQKLNPENDFKVFVKFNGKQHGSQLIVLGCDYGLTTYIDFDKPKSNEVKIYTFFSEYNYEVELDYDNLTCEKYYEFVDELLEEIHEDEETEDLFSRFFNTGDAICFTYENGNLILQNKVYFYHNEWRWCREFKNDYKKLLRFRRKYSVTSLKTPKVLKENGFKTYGMRLPDQMFCYRVLTRNGFAYEFISMTTTTDQHWCMYGIGCCTFSYTKFETELHDLLDQMKKQISIYLK